MWRYLWLLTVFLDFGFGSADRSYFGLKHVRVTSDTCAVIIGRNLRKTETDLRREKVSAPCFDGPHVFGVYGSSLAMCYVESDSVLKCVENDGYGFTHNVLDTHLADCGLTKIENLEITSNDSIRLFSSSSICYCDGGNNCTNTGDRNAECHIPDVPGDDYGCECDRRVNAGGYDKVCLADPGYFYAHDKEFWEYFEWPAYDFFSDYDFSKPAESENIYYLFNHVNNDDICTIAVRQAFEEMPFYYFDTGRMENRVFEPVCADEGAKFAVARFAAKNISETYGVSDVHVFYGCFLHADGRLECGFFLNTYFVFFLEANLDVTPFNTTAGDYNFFIDEGGKPSDTNFNVNLCAKEMLSSNNQSCYQYVVNSSSLSGYVHLNETIVGEPREETVEGRLIADNGNTTVLFGDSSLNHTLYLQKWGAIYPFLVKGENATIFGRLYGILYTRNGDKCSLEYRQGSYLISEAALPCMPEDSLSLFHITNLDGFYFVEVCHYDDSNDSVICSDHYTNSTSVYALNGCFVYNDPDSWIFGFGKSLFIGNQNGSCMIVRQENGNYLVKQEAFAYECYGNSSLDVSDAMLSVLDNETEYQTLVISKLTEFEVIQFDYVSGTGIYQTCGLTNCYNEDNDISERIFIPEPMQKSPECPFMITLLFDFIILGVDVFLGLLFALIYYLEVKGYRRMKYQEVRDNLIEQKLQAMEAIGRVLV